MSPCVHVRANILIKEQNMAPTKDEFVGDGSLDVGRLLIDFTLL